MTDYQFTPIPTQLFLRLDVNCRSVLFTLLQLSSMYADKDGWFFRTNADLEAEARLSRKVLNGALDALYQRGLIGIVPQEKGRGKQQIARTYKVFSDRFKEFEGISIEDCFKNPKYAIVTLDYKHGSPSWMSSLQGSEQTSVPSSVQGSVPTLVQSSVQSANNIDSIDNEDNIENKENIELNNNNNILGFSKSLDLTKGFEGSEVEANKSERCISEPPTYSKEPSISSEALYISEDKEGDVALSSADLNEILQTAEAERNSIVNSKEFDNYTDAANDILDKDGDVVHSQVQSLLNDEDDWVRLSAEQRLLSVLNSSEGDKRKTARSVVEYSLRRENCERIAAEEREQEAKQVLDSDFLAAITLSEDFDCCSHPYSDFIYEQELRMRQNLNG